MHVLALYVHRSSKLLCVTIKQKVPASLLMHPGGHGKPQYIVQANEHSSNLLPGKLAWPALNWLQG